MTQPALGFPLQGVTSCLPGTPASRAPSALPPLTIASLISLSGWAVLDRGTRCLPRHIYPCQRPTTRAHSPPVRRSSLLKRFPRSQASSPRPGGEKQRPNTKTSRTSHHIILRYTLPPGGGGRGGVATEEREPATMLTRHLVRPPSPTRGASKRRIPDRQRVAYGRNPLHTDLLTRRGCRALTTGHWQGGLR